MTDRKSLTKEATSLSLSLEAISLAKKQIPQPRPISELLNEWRGKPVEASEELKAFMADLRLPQP